MCLFMLWVCPHCHQYIAFANYPSHFPFRPTIRPFRRLGVPLGYGMIDGLVDLPSTLPYTKEGELEHVPSR